MLKPVTPGARGLWLIRGGGAAPLGHFAQNWRRVGERYGPGMASRYPLRVGSEDLLLEPGERRVVVSTPAATELRDLASLRRDFALAHAFLEFYLASDIEGDGSTPSPLDALWISAVTMYGRGFSTGRRHAAHARTEHLTEAETVDHKYFIDLRNKYIAHAVNGFEKTVVFADLSNRDISPAGIHQIGESHSSLFRLARTPAEELKHLCEQQIASVTRLIEQLHVDIGQELVALGIDTVYALPEFEPPTLDGSNPRSQRS